MSKAKRILLVDDDADLLRLLTLRLRAVDYEVMPVKSAMEALAQLIIFRPHLVLTDLRMDGMDGLTLFDAIHQENPALPIIILTAHGTIPDAIAATHRGVFSFLTKPFDGKQLLEHIARALQIAGPDAVAGGEPEAWRAHIITRAGVMEDVLGQAKLIAESDSSVLIRGDSGTGKELVAQAIHRASKRAHKPFIAINCGAIPEPLLESELFGHSKGSFTGAVQQHEGLFRAAHGGTLFLDEIGDMPTSLQVKLLRVIQEKEVRHVGSTRSLPVNVRIVSATHRDLEAAVRSGKFREDLYYRLNVVSLEIPTLSQRREDIPLLAMHFLHKLAQRSNKAVRSLAPEAMELLVSASWPGNVRQLHNVLEQTVVLSTAPVISAALVRKALRAHPLDMLSLKDARDRFEQHYLIRLLQITQGNVSHAARLAKRNRTEFYKLLHRHQLDPTDFKTENVLGTDDSEALAVSPPLLGPSLEGDSGPT